MRAHVCQLTPAQLAPLIEFHPASLDHMDFVSDEDIAVLAKLDTVATLLPAANYFLGLEAFPPARKLIDSGVPVALATDYNPGTAPDAVHALCAFGCVHAHEDVARRGDRRGHLQRRLCAAAARAEREALSRAKTPTSPSSTRPTIASCAYWFGINRCRKTLMDWNKRISVPSHEVAWLTRSAAHTISLQIV